MSSRLRTTRRWRLAVTVASAGALAGAAAATPALDTPDVRVADPGHRKPIDTGAVPPVLGTAPQSEQFLIAASATQVEPAPDPGPETVVDEAPTAEPTPTREPTPEPTPAAEPARSVWDRVADCESGAWTSTGGFVPSSATWSSTAGLFEGGLQFHPDTWDGYRDADMPAAAYDATREQQIAVAERVLAAQGWEAWPVCSRKLGLR